MTIKKLFSFKNIFLASLLLLICSLAAILLFNSSVDEPGQTVSAEFSFQGNTESREATYYPGTKDTAFLLAVPQYDSSYQTLLRELLNQDYPVLLTRCHVDAVWNPEKESTSLEANSDLLSKLSSVESSQQVWIGIHDGASALLDQVVQGSYRAKAAVLLSPILDSKQIDNAIIINGNYHNQTDWINSLSPEMARQPMLFLTSSNDDISTPYQMTLLYNKFSTDKIIHVGGVYHAKRNGIFLSIIDGGFHSLVPTQLDTMNEISSFLNQIPDKTTLNISFAPTIKNFLISAIGFFLLVCFSSAVLLAPHYAPEISYGLPSALHLEKKGKLFGTLFLSGFSALLLSVVLYSLTASLSYSFVLSLAGFLFSFWGFSKLFAKIFSFKISPSFQTVAIPKKNLLYTIFLSALLFVSLWILMDISGLLKLYPLLWTRLILLAASSGFILSYYLTVDELLREDACCSVRIAFYITFLLPFLLLALIASIFLGSSCAFFCLVLLGLMLLHTLLARAIFVLCGHILPAVLIPSCCFSFYAVLFSSI